VTHATVFNWQNCFNCLFPSKTLIICNQFTDLHEYEVSLYILRLHNGAVRAAGVVAWSCRRHEAALSVAKGERQTAKGKRQKVNITSSPETTEETGIVHH
jgi:hypothetical protein